MTDARLTDEELDALEARAKEPAGSLWKKTVVDLVAEVRRLRALVKRVAASSISRCMWCGEEETCQPDCLLVEIEREAGA